MLFAKTCCAVMIKVLTWDRLTVDTNIIRNIVLNITLLTKTRAVSSGI